MTSCFLALALTLVGCKDGARELYDTAQFEEVQNNKKHARKLYQRIVAEYPDSPYAGKAKQDLARLREGPGTSP